MAPAVRKFKLQTGSGECSITKLKWVAPHEPGRAQRLFVLIVNTQ